MNTNGFTNGTNYLSTDYTDYHRGIHKCAQMVSQIGTNGWNADETENFADKR